jgi:spermidine synthase
MPELTEPAVRVRETTDGRELRVSGTLASLYRPGQATTGLIWDALAAPLTLLPPDRRQSVLILGLGGGSVARVIRALAPQARIVGVERSPAVVEAAQRHLDLDALGIEVHVEDARAFLSMERGTFDTVVEDIFEGGTHNLRKPAWLLAEGLPRAVRLLKPGGLIVSNTIGQAHEVTRALRATWPRLVWIETHDYENKMVVGGENLRALVLRQAIATEPLLAEVRTRLYYRTV